MKKRSSLMTPFILSMFLAKGVVMKTLNRLLKEPLTNTAYPLAIIYDLIYII